MSNADNLRALHDACNIQNGNLRAGPAHLDKKESGFLKSENVDFATFCRHSQVHPAYKKGHNDQKSTSMSREMKEVKRMK